MTDRTLRLHRVLRTTPERLFRALTDPEALVKWLPPHGFTAKVHHLKPGQGGSYRMSFTNLGTGHTHAFGGDYLVWEPGKRLVHTDVFDDPGLPGQMVTTIDIRPVFCGVEAHFVQENIPAPIPLEACYLGWQESLQLLTLLVEADIPAG